MRGLMGLNWRVSVPAVIFAAALGLLVLDPLGFRPATQALSLELASRPLPSQTSDSTIFVDIDRLALNEGGPWPWPRTLLARLIQATDEAGAETIVLALSLRGDDPAAPQRAIEALAATGDADARALEASLPDTNAALAEMLRTTGTALAIPTTWGEGPAAAENLATTTFEIGNGGQLDFVPEIAAPSLGSLEAASGVTRVAQGLRTDLLGRVTATDLIVRAGDAILPTAAALPLLAATDLPVEIIAHGRPGAMAFVDPVGLTAVTIGITSVPTLPDGAVPLRRDIDVPVVSAADVLRGNAGQLEGRAVVIGSSLSTVAGGAAAPFDGLSPAQGIALAMAQTSEGLTPTRPFVLNWIEVLAAMLLGGLALYMIYAERPRAGLAVALFLSAALMVGSMVVLMSQAMLLDGLAPALVMLVTALAGLATAPAATQGARGRYNHALEGKLPYGAPLRMARNARKILEHAESRKTTVLICTIRDFEQIQDLYTDDPEGLAGIVTQFHDMISDKVRSTGGTVDRYGGATVLAFWNAPVDEPDHALKACDCALRLIDSLEKLNQMIEAQAYRTGTPFFPIHLGIGINTGRAVMGNIGARGRPDYSAVGETIMVAQQLLEASAHYGPAIIVGEHTFQAVKNRFALLEVDKIAVPAKTYSIRVFALLGNPVTKASPRFRALEEAHEGIFEAYRTQNWSLAEALIRESRKLNGAIPSLYDLYDARISYYRQNPPATDWDGAFTVPVV